MGGGGGGVRSVVALWSVHVFGGVEDFVASKKKKKMSYGEGPPNSSAVVTVL